MALSRKFHWVLVNRDRTPDIPKRFSVSAYPSLITLGKNREKVHRFQGYKTPGEFKKRLEDALRRHDLYLEGKEWDTPDERPATICNEGTVESFPAPAEDVPSGITLLGEKIWIAQGGKLYAVDPKDGKAAEPLALPESVRALCTDGTRLFAMEYGWTAGKPIHVLDPATGKATRAIVTEANKKNRSMGAAGIAWRDGKLYVLAGMRGLIHEIDPETGRVTRTIDTGVRWLSALAFDGRRFIAGSRKALYFLDPQSGQVTRTIAVNYPLRALAARDGSVYLMEQPVFGHNKDHKRIQVWPKKTLVYKLTLQE